MSRPRSVAADYAVYLAVRSVLCVLQMLTLPAARRLAGAITVTLQAALLVRHAPGPVAAAFCASRLAPGALPGPGVPFGTLPDGLALDAVLGRATPAHG